MCTILCLVHAFAVKCSMAWPDVYVVYVHTYVHTYVCMCSSLSADALALQEFCSQAAAGQVPLPSDAVQPLLQVSQ